jgi:hypothetical protein
MPKLHAITYRDPKTHQITKVVLFGAPITLEQSELTVEVDAVEELKISIKQAPVPNKDYWKPNEIIIGIEAVRTLRDACNRFLDKFHDEAERS